MEVINTLNFWDNVHGWEGMDTARRQNKKTKKSKQRTKTKTAKTKSVKTKSAKRTRRKAGPGDTLVVRNGKIKIKRK